MCYTCHTMLSHCENGPPGKLLEIKGLRRPQVSLPPLPPEPKISKISATYRDPARGLWLLFDRLHDRHMGLLARSASSPALTLWPRPKALRSCVAGQTGVWIDSRFPRLPGCDLQRRGRRNEVPPCATGAARAGTGCRGVAARSAPPVHGRASGCDGASQTRRVAGPAA